MEIPNGGSDWSSGQVISDDCLTLVFNEMNPKDLFRLERVSKQFTQCISDSLKPRKCFSVLKSEENLRQLGNFWCYEKHGPKVNDYFLNDLKPSVTQIRKIFLFNERMDVLKSITTKCPSIESLTLRECYLNEIVIRFFNENLKGLKCLSLQCCHIPFQQFVSSEQTKVLSKKVIHLSLFCVCDSVDDRRLEDEEHLDLIRLFPNVVKLRVDFTEALSFEKMFERLTPSIVYILMDSYLTPTPQPIPNTIFEKQNILQLRTLHMIRYIAPKETIERIITSMNLKVFSFCCHQLSSTLIQKLTRYQTELKDLDITNSIFTEFENFKRNVIFKKVVYLELNNPRLNPIYFRKVIDMFPKTKGLIFCPWFGIKCIKGEQHSDCKTCFYSTYELIPRLKCVQWFQTTFNSIGRQLIECLDRLPELSFLKISCFHGHPNYTTHIPGDSYNKGVLKDLINYLFRRCEEKPQKLFKFRLDCSRISLPQDFKRPRNLKILKPFDRK